MPNADVDGGPSGPVSYQHQIIVSSFSPYRKNLLYGYLSQDWWRT